MWAGKREAKGGRSLLYNVRYVTLNNGHTNASILTMRAKEGPQ